MLNLDLFDNSDKILLAISGGIDSMVMLSLFCQIKNVNISIAHVNYGLREQDSDLDELLVKSTAERHHLKSFFLHPNIHSVIKEKGISLQAAARVLRYEWFENLSKEHGFTKIATAHHLDDQAETIILNLVRGSGLQGLTGISATRNSIIRPLLQQSKANILKYAIQNQINYREDASNNENKYARNQIRNLVIPALEDINPKASKHVSHAGNILNKYAGLVQYFINEIKHNWISEKGDTIIKLKNIPPTHLETILFELIKSTKIKESQLHDLIKAYLNKSTGATFISPSHHLLLDRGQLIIKPITAPLEIEILLHLEERHHPEVAIFSNIEQVPYPKKWPDSKWVAHLSLTKLDFPLLLRNWRPGDRMAPLGMEGQTKKIQDILTDKKVNSFEKKSALVLLNNLEICWLVGYAVSENFKAQKGKEVIRITLNKGHTL